MENIISNGKDVCDCGSVIFGNLGAGTFIMIVAVLAIWSIIWKGLALWQASKRGEKIWFIAMLVLNTVGVLEIIYLIINRTPKVSPPISPTPESVA